MPKTFANRKFDESNYLARYFEDVPLAESDAREKAYSTKIKTQTEAYVPSMVLTSEQVLNQAASGRSPAPPSGPNPFPKNDRDRRALR